MQRKEVTGQLVMLAEVDREGLMVMNRDGGVSRCLIFFMEGEDSKSETGIVGPLEGGEAVTDDASVVQLRELLTWSRASWL